MSGAEVLLEDVSKRFGSPGEARRRGAQGPGAPVAALERLSLAVAKGEIVALVGPSGCGKSTTLRIVAGLEEPDGGTVTIAGRPMRGVPPQARDVAMVFQGYALYPQMTARQIIEFPLAMRKVPAAARARAVDEVAGLLRIGALLDRRPAELSGGERQRVAMGRALVRKPRVFLFDEPLSNLDLSLRADLRLEIAELVRRLEATALYVTHDHVEAMTMADRIAVLRAGRLLQVAPPREVYERPATSFVGTFIGSPRMNILPAVVEQGAIRAGPFRLPPPAGRLPARIEVGVRPEHVSMGPEGEAGEILAVEPLGAESHVLVRVGGVELRAQARGFDPRRRGDPVGVGIDASRALVFDAEGAGERVA